MRKEFRPSKPTHAQAGMAGPERSRLVAEAIAKAHSLLHQRIAERLRSAPPGEAQSMIERARREIARMAQTNTVALGDLAYWEHLLTRPVEEIANELDAHSRDRDLTLPAASPWKRA